MPWLRIRLPASTELAPRLADAFEEAGAASVSVSGEDDEHVLQAATEPTAYWSRNWVSGLFPDTTDVAQVLAVLQAQLPEAALPVPYLDRLSDEDWAESWKANYHPLAVTDRLWICPSWVKPPDPEAVNIILDPGLAFGTGDHPTTFLCLAWLAAQDLRGKTVIDFGCGSGILSIAAVKLGAAKVMAVDIDPQALAITAENAARNAVGERVRVCLPAELPFEADADLVIANILARPLIELAPLLTGLVRPGGSIALSGMLEEQRELVEPYYSGHFRLAATARGGWVLLAGPRQADSVSAG